MSEDQFIKLFKYMQEQFKLVNEKLDQKADKADVEAIIRAVDGLAGRASDMEFENAVRDKQQSKLNSWAKKVAVKTSIPLDI